MRRPVTVRRRHAVHPRADARRRPAAAACGACSTPSSRRARRRCGAPSFTTAPELSACPSGRRPAVDALYAPRRTVIDALLVDAAQRAGATVEFGTPGHRAPSVRGDGRVTGGLLAGGRRSGRCPAASHRERAAGDRRGRKGTPWLPGWSRATNECGRPACRQLLYGYWADFPPDGYEWFYGPGLTAGAIPTNAGLTCVFIGGHPGRDRAAWSCGGRRRRPSASLTEPAGTGHGFSRAPGGAGPVRPGAATRLPPHRVRAGLGVGRGRRSLDRPDRHPRYDVGLTGCGIARPGGVVRARPVSRPTVRAVRHIRPPATGSVQPDDRDLRGDRLLTVGISSRIRDIVAVSCLPQ